MPRQIPVIPKVHIFINEDRSKAGQHVAYSRWLDAPIHVSGADFAAFQALDQIAPNAIHPYAWPIR